MYFAHNKQLSNMNRRISLFICAVVLAFSLYAQVPEGLPELLYLPGNDKVESATDWENLRRPWILENFKSQIYGDIPDTFKPEVSFQISEKGSIALDGRAIRKQIKIIVRENALGKEVAIDLLLYLPRELARPVPVFLGLNFYGNHTIHPDPSILITDSWVRNNEDFSVTGNHADERSRGVRINRWPVEYIIERGYGLATIYYGDMDPDFDDQMQNGLHALMNFKKGSSLLGDAPGSIAIWAKGLSLAVDYFETDKDIDEARVIVLGHSRLGKAALWAGALDQRFAMVISNNSGCGGAALSMRKHGETVEKINTQFPHWFCENFKKYNQREEELPVDQHMLISLIAPRPVYVASAKEDDWADPRGEQLSVWLAGQVYALYGLSTHLSGDYPVVNNPLKEGYTGYHIRTGIHDITPYDWEQFLDFADFYFY